MGKLKMLLSSVAVLDTRIAKPPLKEADPIYSDRRYSAWRVEVIRRAGGICQWPGCGRKEKRMFADHIRELSDQGSAFDPNNGQCLCGKHHTIKTNLARAARMRKSP